MNLDTYAGIHRAAIMFRRIVIGSTIAALVLVGSCTGAIYYCVSY